MLFGGGNIFLSSILGLDKLSCICNLKLVQFILLSLNFLFCQYDLLGGFGLDGVGFGGSFVCFLLGESLSCLLGLVSLLLEKLVSGRSVVLGLSSGASRFTSLLGLVDSIQHLSGALLVLLDLVAITSIFGTFHTSGLLA